MANSFLDPNDRHVLADDMEKNREAKEYGHAPAPQANPFAKPGVPIMSPGVRFAQGINGQTIGPIFASDLARAEWCRYPTRRLSRSTERLSITK
jgi:hypothetical protein